MKFKEIFNGLPAISENIHQLVVHQDKILMLDITNKGNGEIRFLVRKMLKSLGVRRIDLFNVFMTIRDNNPDTIPDAGATIVYSADADGYKQETYQLNEKVTLDDMPKKFLRRMRETELFIQCDNLAILLNYSYLYFLLDDFETKQSLKKEAVKLGYTYQGQNSFGLDVLRDTKKNYNSSSLDLPPAETIKSIELPEFLMSIVQRFEENDSMISMQTHELRYLDSGYFVRVELEYGNEKKDVLKLLSFLGELPKTGMVYHGFLAEHESTNYIINSVPLSDYDLPYNLPSFWKELSSISDFILKRFYQIMYDGSLFVNHKMIFSFYDKGFDINFTISDDRELFIKLLISDGYRIAKYTGYERAHYEMYTQSTYWELG